MPRPDRMSYTTAPDVASTIAVEFRRARGRAPVGAPRLGFRAGRGHGRPDQLRRRTLPGPAVEPGRPAR